MESRITMLLAAVGLALACAGPAAGSAYPWIDLVDYPADGAVDVPLNPVLSFDNMHIPAQTELVLSDPTGAVVPIQRWDQDVEGECETWEPAAELDPLTEYTVTITSIDDDEWITTFTTGDARDDEAATVSVDADAECDGTDFEFPITASEEIVVAMFVAEMETFCISPRGGTVSFSHEEGSYVSSVESLIFVDGGGNRSEATGVDTVDEDGDCWEWQDDDSGDDGDSASADGCQCDASGNGTGAGTLAASAALVLLAMRRRR